MSALIQRRTFLGLLGAGSLVALSPVLAGCSQDAPTSNGSSGTALPEAPTALPPAVQAYGVDPALLAMTVHKSATCGCCGAWIEHAQQHGFAVNFEDIDDLGTMFASHEVAMGDQSCHLAVNSAGTIFVGHVAARFVLDYLADPPPGSRGLSVPSMPVGTPGMEQGDDFDPYDVLLLLEGGGTRVYASVNQPADQEI